jgi:hypothetical protein
MGPLFHIFRHKANRTLEFVGSTQTLEASRQLVKSKAAEPSERFAIYSVLTGEITYLNADEVCR